jgi:ribose 1,5-bisphosphokinase
MADPAQMSQTGTLILVVGASGAGKDTLLEAAHEHFRANSRVYFPRRIITRQSKTGEDHIPVSPTDFATLKLDNRFFLDWQAHGLEYGIPIEIKTKLERGDCVVINSSRKMIDEARSRWNSIKVLHVVIQPQALRARLQQRGRETAEEIERRIERASTISVADDADTITIDNSGPLEKSIEVFLNALAIYVPKG